jgi:two-component system, cell cycle response regulator DivK
VGGVDSVAKILLVEDHPDIRNMMATYLVLNKYEVIEAENGYDAIQQALDHKPDVILMDIAMPVLDGISSARAMRENEELAGVPIFCLTAFGEFYRDRARMAGCNAVLQKPIDFRSLDALLEEHTQ